MKTLTKYSREHRKNPTEAELFLKKQFQRWKIKFRSQRPIDYYIVDFILIDYRMIVEVDGNSHIGKEIYDKKREMYLKNLGYSFLRLTNEEVLSGSVDFRDFILKQPKIDRTKFTIKQFYGMAKY